MDTTVSEKSVKVNHGLNIRRIRAATQLKQEIFAKRIGMAQQTVSYYESQEVLDDEVLEKCAVALNVPVEVLKYMPDDESAPVQIFKDGSFTNSDTATGNNSIANSVGTTITNNYQCTPETLKVLGEVVEILKEEIEVLKEGTRKPKTK